MVARDRKSGISGLGLGSNRNPMLSLDHSGPDSDLIELFRAPPWGRAAGEHEGRLLVSLDDRIARIVATAETRFGQPVRRVTAPGGTARSSFRLHFDDRSVIATLRPDYRRTHLEAFVLKRLHKVCDDVPDCLGVADDILFQSDIGRRRLNRQIVRVAADYRLHLAAEAVQSLFRIQAAARRTTLTRIVPALGATPAWISGLVDAADVLNPYSRGIPARFDRVAARARLTQPAAQFVKWDSRSGNAAIGADGRVRWFDFEYAGRRHGAEDFAWLIADESWPLAPEDMVDVMIDAFDPGCGHAIEPYLEYLSVYITFHSLQRLHLVQREVRLRGWLSKKAVRKFDEAGAHPEFAAQLCLVGRYFSAQSRITAPLTGPFDDATRYFQGIGRAEGGPTGS